MQNEKRYRLRGRMQNPPRYKEGVTSPLGNTEPGLIGCVSADQEYIVRWPRSSSSLPPGIFLCTGAYLARSRQATHAEACGQMHLRCTPAPSIRLDLLPLSRPAQTEVLQWKREGRRAISAQRSRLNHSHRLMLSRNGPGSHTDQINAISVKLRLLTYD